MEMAIGSLGWREKRKKKLATKGANEYGKKREKWDAT